jgi:flavodoxin
MNSVVIYGSRHGNTRKIAEAIASGLKSRGTVKLLEADDAPSVLPHNTDLVVIGGPTEAHRMTEPMAHFFDRLADGALSARAAAGFDTRLRWPLWLSGSAGAGITARLYKMGARVISPEASFLVNRTAAGGKLPVLVPGELERAKAWGASLAEKVERAMVAA